MDRRDFLKASIGAAAAFRTAQAMPGDKFRWACTSGMFRNLDGQPDSTLKTISDYGFQGVEAALQLEQSCGSAMELKNRMDRHEIACANYWGGGEYYNPQNPEAVRATVADNIGLARDHVAVCGGRPRAESQSHLARHGRPSDTELVDDRRNERPCENPQ